VTGERRRGRWERGPGRCRTAVNPGFGHAWRSGFPSRWCSVVRGNSCRPRRGCYTGGCDVDKKPVLTLAQRVPVFTVGIDQTRTAWPPMRFRFVRGYDVCSGLSLAPCTLAYRTSDREQFSKKIQHQGFGREPCSHVSAPTVRAKETGWLPRGVAAPPPGVSPSVAPCSVAITEPDARSKTVSGDSSLPQAQGNRLRLTYGCAGPTTTFGKWVLRGPCSKFSDPFALLYGFKRTLRKTGPRFLVLTWLILRTEPEYTTNTLLPSRCLGLRGAVTCPKTAAQLQLWKGKARREKPSTGGRSVTLLDPSRLRRRGLV